MHEFDVECDVMVIGAGMAGMASSLFAVKKGLSVAQAGVFGEIMFASGLFDLMGVYPVGGDKQWDDPWAAIDAVKHHQPGHVYANVDKNDIRRSMDDMLSFLSGVGLSYRRDENRNSGVITPLGTVKKTWCVPETMWNGVAALKNKPSCRLVDFHGLKGFSAKQISETLKAGWPELSSVRIDFPGTTNAGDLYGEYAARHLELEENRTRFAEAVGRHVNDVDCVGFPSIFGVTKTHEVFRDLQEKLGVPIFEIPGLPPSLNGLRLMESYRDHLPRAGVRTFYQKRVLGYGIAKDGSFILDVGTAEKDMRIHAKHIILATGRFFGNGLCEDKNRLKEPLFNLPVVQPGSRKAWYNKDLLDRDGHGINNAGLLVDELFRPIDDEGRPVFKRLFAAGSILAHHDWKRMKCGTGLAVVSGYKAAEAVLKV